MSVGVWVHGLKDCSALLSFGCWTLKVKGTMFLHNTVQ